MSDPFVDKTLRLLAEILGIGPETEYGVPEKIRRPGFTSVPATPPSLPHIEESMERFGQHDRLESLQRLTEPGAMVFDTRPSEVLTEAQHKERRDYHNDRGYTYRPPPEVSVPASQFPDDTIFLP